MGASNAGDNGHEGPPPVAYRRGRSPFRAAPQDPLLARALPVSAHIPAYRTHTARRDLIAGLTVAALALPSGMAYAEVAGLSPVNGLYALLLPAVLYTFLGSSRQLIVGPEGSISALVGAAILPLAAAGTNEAAELAAMLALLVGACFLLAWSIRLGWLADYFSRPVLIGYIHGVAIVLVCGQLGKLLGIDIDASKPIGQVVEALQELGEVSGTTLARQHRRARSHVRAAASFSRASRCADRRRHLDRRVLGSRPRRSRCRRARPDPLGVAERRDPDAAPRRRRRTRARRDRDLPRQLRRRNPHREDVRREAEPVRAGEPGAPRLLGA